MRAILMKTKLTHKNLINGKLFPHHHHHHQQIIIDRFDNLISGDVCGVL